MIPGIPFPWEFNKGYHRVSLTKYFFQAVSSGCCTDWRHGWFPAKHSGKAPQRNFCPMVFPAKATSLGPIRSPAGGSVPFDHAAQMADAAQINVPVSPGQGIVKSRYSSNTWVPNATTPPLVTGLSGLWRPCSWMHFNSHKKILWTHGKWKHYRSELRRVLLSFAV